MTLPKFNINSKDHLSALLFSGTIKVDVVEPCINPDGTLQIVKKTGQIKCKKVKKDLQVEGFGLLPLASWKTKKEGVYQVNKIVLESIANEQEED